MAAYNVTNRERIDGYAVVRLLNDPEVTPGETVTIAGVGDGFDGTVLVLARPTYAFRGISDEGDLEYDGSRMITRQVLYANAGADVDRGPAVGTLTYSPVVAWIDDDDVANYIGLASASHADAEFLDECAKAANRWAYRRRRNAGYRDPIANAPSDDVKLGTIIYAGNLYRARGSLGDALATFDSMPAPPVIGASAIVRQLLGIDRPAVA